MARTVEPQLEAGARLQLPPLGGVAALAIVCSICGLYAGIAAYCLRHISVLNWIEIGGSVLALGGVGLIVYSGIEEQGGLRGAMTRCAGAFARTAFLEITQDRDGIAMLRHGFHLFGTAFTYSEIAIDRVYGLSWSAGQGSDMSGKDLNDWHVFIDHHAKRWNQPDDWRSVVVISPSLSSKDAHTLGTKALGFLQRAGVRLMPDQRESSYVTAPPLMCEEAAGRDV